jgi:hypothetical protein
MEDSRRFTFKNNTPRSDADAARNGDDDISLYRYEYEHTDDLPGRLSECVASLCKVHKASLESSCAGSSANESSVFKTGIPVEN